MQDVKDTGVFVIVELKEPSVDLSSVVDDLETFAEEVWDKYIEIRVPKVIILLEYKLEAAAEKPHWGTIPNKLPKTGPNLPDFLINAVVLSPAFCSINSITKYAKNKNGNNFIVSINVCSKTCNIFIPLF